MKILSSIEQDSRNDQPQVNQQDRLSEHQIEVVWLRMTEIYGNSWESSRGPLRRPDGYLAAHAKAWADALSDLTAPQIAYGLMRCRDNPSHVPAIAEFHALCTG